MLVRLPWVKLVNSNKDAKISNKILISGSGMGYEGIFNSLAIEIDTYFNFDNLDFYENHVSVMTEVIFF